MDSALCQCGRNGAHKSFPHATLCQFFKARIWSCEAGAAVVYALEGLFLVGGGLSIDLNWGSFVEGAVH